MKLKLTFVRTLIKEDLGHKRLVILVIKSL